ncbi:MAG TPA: HAMP domain-containing protein, partial [Terriglobales bacterium]|nr:HAMP domain-containing protein [Terriglobales bacterium]
MKGRLSSTVWILVAATLVGMLVVFVLGFGAGAYAQGLPFLDALGRYSETGTRALGALAIMVGVCFVLYLLLSSRVLKPARELAEYSEKLAAGDYRSKVQIDSADDFGYIADNLNLSADKVSKAVFNQEAQESLQRSVTDFLTIV